MELKANSSNNTIYADADGTIAYFHGNFLPRRDTSFDWDPSQWMGVIRPPTGRGFHAVDELPNLLNPSSGWLYNSNNSPWSAAGAVPVVERADFPAYVEMGTENARGLHALRVLSDKKDFTLDSLITAAYDSYLPWFERALPSLIQAWDAAPPFDPLKARLSDQIRVLRGWDYRWAVDSTATTLAVYWGEELRRARVPVEDFVPKGTPSQLLAALDTAVNRLTGEFGKWSLAWGDINRYQRLTGDLVQPFNDDAPSIAVGFTSGNWGSLASFGARPYPRHQEVVRNQREQLRSGGRVRDRR